jgi:hypothetical protein
MACSLSDQRQAHEYISLLEYGCSGRLECESREKVEYGQVARCTSELGHKCWDKLRHGCSDKMGHIYSDMTGYRCRTH